MLDFLVSWAEQLIIALIIIIMVEMIIPNSNYRKYIKVILGIFVMYVIFSPLISGKLENFNFSETFSYQENETINITNQSQINYDKQIEETYKEKFKENLQEYLKEKGYEIDKLEISIKYENENITTNQLEITIKEFTQSNNITINKVTITDESEIKEEELEKLKEEISTNYDIESSKISITESEK